MCIEILQRCKYFFLLSNCLVVGNIFYIDQGIKLLAVTGYDDYITWKLKNSGFMFSESIGNIGLKWVSGARFNNPSFGTDHMKFAFLVFFHCFQGLKYHQFSWISRVSDLSGDHSSYVFHISFFSSFEANLSNSFKFKAAVTDTTGMVVITLFSEIFLEVDLCNFCDF